MKLPSLRARIISIPTFPRDTRYRNTTSPSANSATSISRSTGARSASASRACIWKKTPARACTTDPAEYTSLDLNRCGTPLTEIVSEPDIRSPQEAYEYLTKLKEIILFTGVSDCNMEEGSLRCDANVSVRPVGQKEFGTKAEVKNVNSFRFIREALEYEIERQIGFWSPAARFAQETRLYNPDQGKTYAMRSQRRRA